MNEKSYDDEECGKLIGGLYSPILLYEVRLGIWSNIEYPIK